MNAYQSSQYDQMLCNAYDDMAVLVFITPGVLQRGIRLSPPEGSSTLGTPQASPATGANKP